MKLEANKKRRDVDDRIKVGSKVWLNLEGISLNRFNLRPCPKLNPKYFGPFEVIAQPGLIRYKLKLPDDAYIHDTFHVARLKPYNDPAMVRFRSRQLPTEYRDTTEYEIEKILDHDVMWGSRWYNVHWRGYDEVTESSWESRSSLISTAPKAVRAYESKFPIVPGEKTRKKRQRK